VRWRELGWLIVGILLGVGTMVVLSTIAAYHK